MKTCILILFAYLFYPLHAQINETIEYSIKNHSIYYQDEKINIKGITWNGIESEIYAMNGNWIIPMEDTFTKLNYYNINTINIPVSVQNILYGQEDIPPCFLNSKNENLCGQPTLNVLEYVIQKCLENNILVMFTMDRIHNTYLTPSQNILEKKKDILDTILLILRQFKKYPNVFGMTIYRQPRMDQKIYEEFLSEIILVCRENFANRYLYLVQGNELGTDFSLFSQEFISTFRDFILFSPQIIDGSFNHYEEKTLVMDLFADWQIKFGFLMQYGAILPTQILSSDSFFINYFGNFMLELDTHNIIAWNIDVDPYQGILEKNWFQIKEYKLLVLNKIQTSSRKINF